MAVTWNPADKDASISLSNGNLTAAPTVATSATCRATQSRSTGKYHVELVCDSAGPWPGLAVGSAALNDWLGNNANSIGFYIDAGSWRPYYNGAYIGTIGAVSLGPPPGTELALEIDFAAATMKGAINAGAFSGDIDISALIALGAIFPAMTSTVSGGSVTIRPDAASFTKAISSNFLAWDADPVFTPTVFDPLDIVPYKLRSAPMANR